MQGFLPGNLKNLFLICRVCFRGDIKFSCGKIASGIGNAKSSTGNSEFTAGNIKFSTGNTRCSIGNIKFSTGNTRFHIDTNNTTVNSGDPQFSIGEQIIQLSRAMSRSKSFYLSARPEHTGLAER